MLIVFDGEDSYIIEIVSCICVVGIGRFYGYILYIVFVYVVVRICRSFYYIFFSVLGVRDLFIF